MGRTTKKTPATTQLDATNAIRWVFPAGIDLLTELRGLIVVGREPPSAPILDSQEISRRHAQLQTDAGGTTTIVDLHSTNGVYVNGKVVDRAVLTRGDVLRLGDHVGIVVGTSPSAGASASFMEQRIGDRAIRCGQAVAGALQRARAAAADPMNHCLIIEAEPGTETKYVALAFHHAVRTGKRGKPRPFVPVDCASLDAAERRLFGSWNGALPYRSSNVDGVIFASDNGTIFLDDLAALPSTARTHLLQLIDARDAVAGNAGDSSFRVWFVLATSNPSTCFDEQIVRSGSSWERLARNAVRIPPLRERRDEIPQLLQQMMSLPAPGHPIGLNAKLVEALCVHDWPGNVRELESVARALLAAHARGEVLGLRHVRHLLPNREARPTNAMSSPTPQPRPPRPLTADPVKILFLAANPQGTGALNIAREFRDIDERLRRMPRRSPFVLAPEFAVRRRDLIELIQRHRPAIVHFSGHGDDDGELMFETSDGDPAPASIDALETIFRVLASKGIRCVVLNACFSSKQAEAIARHVECVVGMGQAVSDTAAIDFAAQFYSSLAFGSSVHEAFELARAQLDLNRIPESATPRLLFRSGIDPATQQLVV